MFLKYLALLLFIGLSLCCTAQISNAEFEKGIALNRENDPDKSLANIETLEKKYPKDARVAYLHGLYNYRSNNTLAALTSFTKAIELNPKFESAYIARSYAFNAKGMTDKAIEDVTAYIKLKPSDGEGYDQRAAYYFAKKDYANALADFDKEITIWPKRYMTYYDAASTMALLKDAKAGDSYFEKGLATDGINKDELNILYAVYLGQKGRYTEAKEKFAIALRDAEDKFYGSDFSIAGLTYYKTKDLDKAIYCYIKAIALNPKDMSFRSNLAGVYLDKKDYNKVLETAKAALAINGDDALNNMFMAVGLKNMGREAEAKVFEDKAKRLEKEQN